MRSIEFHILYPKKSLLQKSLHVVAYPTNPLVLFSRPPKKISLLFRDPKNPGTFRRSKKKIFWSKFQTQPPPPQAPSPVIKICEWSPWARNSVQRPNLLLVTLHLAIWIYGEQSRDLERIFLGIFHSLVLPPVLQNQRITGKLKYRCILGRNLRASEKSKFYVQ